MPAILSHIKFEETGSVWPLTCLLDNLHACRLAYIHICLHACTLNCRYASMPDSPPSRGGPALKDRIPPEKATSTVGTDPSVTAAPWSQLKI